MVVVFFLSTFAAMGMTIVVLVVVNIIVTLAVSVLTQWIPEAVDSYKTVTIAFNVTYPVLASFIFNLSIDRTLA